MQPTSVPEPFTIIGTIVGGSAALRMRKKLKPNSIYLQIIASILRLQIDQQISGGSFCSLAMFCF
ncbi:PEP-CTERM sorting domain-containing protein [Chamaesiphon sp. VAR_48_metabat_135_sub]|uniref:PEP-CTERM sorting domain-containing protein n=1 Tax=Chamaesiphon sp. VAR_48_metabat_135_sub TaxID=2964699 RepID=UPI0037C06F32